MLFGLKNGLPTYHIIVTKGIQKIFGQFYEDIS
jgi:hypothetical protein